MTSSERASIPSGVRLQQEDSQHIAYRHDANRGPAIADRHVSHARVAHEDADVTDAVLRINWPPSVPRGRTARTGGDVGHWHARTRTWCRAGVPVADAGLGRDRMRIVVLNVHPDEGSLCHRRCMREEQGVQGCSRVGESGAGL